MENIEILENIQLPNIGPNNRKCDRYAIAKGVYALMSWKMVKDHYFMGHLIDINKEGCRISFVTERSKAANFLSQKTCKLRFVGAFKMFELDENKVVHDNELIEYSTERISVRRCGIKFDDFVNSNNCFELLLSSLRVS
jgi:hypothetical protein